MHVLLFCKQSCLIRGNLPFLPYLVMLTHIRKRFAETHCLYWFWIVLDNCVVCPHRLSEQYLHFFNCRKEHMTLTFVHKIAISVNTLLLSAQSYRADVLQMTVWCRTRQQSEFTHIVMFRTSGWMQHYYTDNNYNNQ